jgi:ABC-type Fe3+/spermidine/putrescine transport system ATPase subunit
MKLVGLSKAYDKVVALDDVSLQMGVGEFIALRGRVGRGNQLFYIWWLVC